MVFPRQRLAIFVDGCFWHQCPEHWVAPKRNREYWLPKINRNVERDRETDRAMHQAGWRPLRVWEHENPIEVVERVEAALGSSLTHPLKRCARRASS